MTPDPPVSAEPSPAFDFGAAVAEVVRSIPSGRVMTYGDVAAVLGSRASRAVGKVMAHEGADLPWWRVVRSGGHPPVHHEARALEHYRAEGTPLVHGATAWRLDMRLARWSPDPGDRSDDVTGGAGAHRASRPGRATAGPDQGYDPTDPGFPTDPF
ncbi:MGMT family protein [Curtobacterium sp. 458]|uniref:MGMT family protein n=1 Tax=Curtobacterium sp. 458 TaxID=3050069 RepID=UPI0025B49C55|nr:MGMT family protein [Curtobacterium sp. 458]WJY01382.1 MGMT family protein [Curtobacterium sp. 458]